MNENELNSSEIQRVGVSKSIKWTGYESIKSDHATNLVVQTHGSEFTFLFFEIQPPFTIGTPEEQAIQLQELPHVEAKCVAKIVMSIPNVLEAGKVFNEQLDNLRRTIEAAIRGGNNANIE